MYCLREPAFSARGDRRIRVSDRRGLCYSACADALRNSKRLSGRSESCSDAWGQWKPLGESRAMAGIRYAVRIDRVHRRRPTRLRSNSGRATGSYRSVGPRTTDKEMPASAATSPLAHDGLASRGATSEKRLCHRHVIQQSIKAAALHRALYRVKTNTIAPTTT